METEVRKRSNSSRELNSEGLISYDILNVPCIPVRNYELVYDHVNNMIKNKQGGYSVAINALKIVGYNKDAETRKIINGGIIHTPDGVGAVHALKILYKQPSIKLDFPGLILDICNDKSYNVFLLGAAAESNKKAYDAISVQYPNIHLSGRMNGYFKSNTEVLEALKNCKDRPQVVLLALGSPKQEKLSQELYSEFPDVLFVGCGGRFDILAGKLKRAPEWIINNNFEWLYRLLLEPRKRFKQQLSLAKFMVLLYKYIIKKRIKNR